ncbi:MAG: FG-GAP repeat protein [Vicinamibacterales bacterium]
MRKTCVVLAGVLLVVALQQTISSQTQALDGAQQAELVASDGAAGDEFGASVAITGDTAFVGAPGTAGGGVVYVFTRSGRTWTEGQKITAGTAMAGDQFGTSLSLRSASEGDTLIVGAPGASSDTGAAYVFVRAPGSMPFIQQQKLTAGDATAGDRFGTSVSVASRSIGPTHPTDILAVGAPSRTGGTQGAAYVFTRTGTAWSELQRVVGTGGSDGGYSVVDFGSSVAINWSLLIVGAPRSFAPSTSDVGAVFLFTLDAANPMWTQRVEYGGSLNGGRFGSCTAIDLHDALACDGNGQRARGFTRRDEGLWSNHGAGDLLPPTDGASALAIAMGGDEAIAGYSNGSAGSFTGFDFLGIPYIWTFKQLFEPSDANAAGFGKSVALSSNTRVVGAPGVASSRGAAYVFIVPSAEPLLVGFGSGAAGLFQSRGVFDPRDLSYLRFPLLDDHVLPWPDYNARNGELHPATGDIDGDGLDEVVIGLGRGGYGYLAVLDDAAHGYALLKWLQVPGQYTDLNGEIWPALGDVDGDGRDEIVAGRGQGSLGFFVIFQDPLAANGTVVSRQVGWPAYNSARGETRPAVMNIDGGSASEIVMGLGPGGAGWLELFDGAESNYSRLRWLRSTYSIYNAENGETFPAAGDLDEDGYDELVVGLGSGSDGWMEVFDDALRGFAHRQWIQVAWPAYNSANGETHPAVGNMDRDIAPEIALGLGRFPGHGGWVQMVDDAAHGHAILWWTSLNRTAEVTAGVATFPAIGRLR